MTCEIDIRQPAYYSGHGEILLSRLLENGEPEGFLRIGIVSAVRIRKTATVKEHLDLETAGLDLDHIIYTKKRTILEIDISSKSPEAIAIFHKGELSTIQAGTWTEQFAVKPGYSYSLPHLSPTSLQVKSIGGIVYENLLNYTVTNQRCGTLEINLDQSSAAAPISDGEIVRVSYSYPEQQVVKPFSNAQEVVRLRFEAINNVNGQPVVIDCFRVSQDVESRLIAQSKKAEQTTITFQLLADKTKQDQYFTEKMVKL